jgi:hypothetical protein
MKINGITTGKWTRRRGENPDGTTPIVLLNGLARAARAVASDARASLQFGWRQDARDHRWQRFRYDALRSFDRSLAHRAKR